MYVPESRCVGIQIIFTPNKRYMFMYQFIFSSWHIFPVNTLKYTGEALTGTMVTPVTFIYMGVPPGGSTVTTNNHSFTRTGLKELCHDSPSHFCDVSNSLQI